MSGKAIAMSIDDIHGIDTDAMAEKLDDMGVDLLVRWGPGEERDLLFRFNNRAPVHIGAWALMSEALRLFQTDAKVRDHMCHASIRDGLAVQDIDQPAWRMRTLSPEEVAARFPNSPVREV